jgi:deoxycytidine triphosphate deaminase
MARIGLEHLNAGWCDAGWHGSVLTLELLNVTRHHRIKLESGTRIGQIVFFRHLEVPKDHSYATKGRYNKDTSVSQVKKDPRNHDYPTALERRKQVQNWRNTKGA